jgi:hypothetical protein
METPSFHSGFTLGRCCLGHGRHLIKFPNTLSAGNLIREEEDHTAIPFHPRLETRKLHGYGIKEQIKPLYP